jgi:hypothetical protein
VKAHVLGKSDAELTASSFGISVDQLSDHYDVADYSAVGVDVVLLDRGGESCDG